MRTTLTLAFVAALLAAAPARAIWPFGESEEEKAAKLATHVAEVLREPNRLIAQAQDAFDADDTEKAIQLFRQAQEAIMAIEAGEDTSGTAYAPLRIKKFHCISMLDSLALQRAEVNDVRQAVTDTSELEKRLAEERAALVREEQKKEAEAKKLEPPKPPTFAERLPDAQRRLAEATAAREFADQAVLEAEKKLLAAQATLKAASKANAAADAQRFLAEKRLEQAEADAPAEAPENALAAERHAAEVAKQEAGQATQAMAAARQTVTAAERGREDARAAAERARATEADTRLEVEMLQRGIAEEKAAAERERRAAEARQRQIEAEELAKRQAEAKAAAEARAAAEKAKAARDAQAKSQAEADAKARKAAADACAMLWDLKRIDTLEGRLGEALGKWPEDPTLMVLLARLRLLQNRPDDALELVAMVPSGGEAGVDAQLVAAGAYLTRNRPEQAMDVLERAMRAAPTDPRPYFNAAITFLRLPQLDPKRDLAARYYVRSVELGGKRSLSLERRLGME